MPNEPRLKLNNMTPPQLQEEPNKIKLEEAETKDLEENIKGQEDDLDHFADHKIPTVGSRQSGRAAQRAGGMLAGKVTDVLLRDGTPLSLGEAKHKKLRGNKKENPNEEVELYNALVEVVELTPLKISSCTSPRMLICTTPPPRFCCKMPSTKRSSCTWPSRKRLSCTRPSQRRLSCTRP